MELRTCLQVLQTIMLEKEISMRNLVARHTHLANRPPKTVDEKGSSVGSSSTGTETSALVAAAERPEKVLSACLRTLHRCALGSRGGWRSFTTYTRMMRSQGLANLRAIGRTHIHLFHVHSIKKMSE